MPLWYNDFQNPNGLKKDPILINSFFSTTKTKLLLCVDVNSAKPKQHAAFNWPDTFPPK